MRAAAAALTFLLAGGAHASSTPGPTDTQGPLDAALADLGKLVGTVVAGSKIITIDDTSSGSVTTITFNVDPAPVGTQACKDVLDGLQTEVKKIIGTDASYTTTAAGCTPTTGSRRAHQLAPGDVTVTVVKAAATAAPTTSSPTTSAPTTVAPTTASPTTSCPDKYGAAVCAPFLQEGLCESDLGEAWCRASCGRCNECKFADKNVCKTRDDCKWSKKKACKSKAPKSCVDLSKKKCKKADNCKWSKKACRAKNACKKLSKKKCKKADDCKWKKKNKSCKAKKATARRSASLSATQSDESSSDDSLSDDSSESED